MAPSFPVPILRQSSLPLPDTHMVAALLAGTKRWGHILPKVLVKFGQGAQVKPMWEDVNASPALKLCLYRAPPHHCTVGRQGSFIPSNSAWASKRAAAVYRGSCLPTIDSDSHSGRVFTRSDLCKLYGGRNRWARVQYAGIYAQCGPCRVTNACCYHD